MKKLRLLVFVLLFTWILPACKSDLSDYMPDIDLPLSKMNQELHFDLDAGLNDYTMGQLVSFYVYNTSSLPIEYNPVANIHLFQRIDEQWEVVDNRYIYSNGINQIAPYGSKTSMAELVSVVPVVYSEEPMEIRIVMVGNYVKENLELGKEVGAYVDVTLKPE